MPQYTEELQGLTLWPHWLSFAGLGLLVKFTCRDTSVTVSAVSG